MKSSAHRIIMVAALVAGSIIRAFYVSFMLAFLYIFYGKLAYRFKSVNYITFFTCTHSHARYIMVVPLLGFHSMPALFYVQDVALFCCVVCESVQHFCA